MGRRGVVILGLVSVETVIVLYLSLGFWITVAVTRLESARVFVSGVALVAVTSTLIGSAVLISRQESSRSAGPMQAVLVANILLLGLCLIDTLRSVLSSDLSVGALGLFSASMIVAAGVASRRQSAPSATPA